jgi:hypothetical protein
MKSFLFSLFLILLISTDEVRSQVSFDEESQTLEELFNRLVDNYNDTDRIRINDSIKMVIDSYVKSESVFTHKFTNLRYLGQITSPDSLVKIITWNLVLENEPGKYYCYFIRKKENSKQNLIYRLSAKYHTNKINTDTTYYESNWYGALYYDLKPVFSNDNRCWVLLGIDYGNSAVSRKIIDVLNFKPDDSIEFGRKWFVSENGDKYRVVFEYASNAMMSLRFRSSGSIIFDHLVPFSIGHQNDPQFYGPDYSLDAYNFENGLWKLVINVDERTQ